MSLPIVVQTVSHMNNQYTYIHYLLCILGDEGTKSTAHTISLLSLPSTSSTATNIATTTTTSTTTTTTTTPPPPPPSSPSPAQYSLEHSPHLHSPFTTISTPSVSSIPEVQYPQSHHFVTSQPLSTSS
ncbi:hypothetical protein M406DRAFT_68779 [Cryphonectria parasitica EP155]|uniref:Uncharacterized protein n=1 Tax=Cryphonectria parasitica (strain ATCC 38755 / EP155) TaxID=660469 RepID=A0A9P4Y5D8_CRYP1|nr:uncharacterized protein M406DRAFT_68779 [Cryphonectria parasitica EP155]KAF3766440.1 hypothetical protein M406DRAFT_68779 [Cryphonectria parasitica EP155]